MKGHFPNHLREAHFDMLSCTFDSTAPLNSLIANNTNPLCSIGSEPFTIGHEGGRLLVFQGFADIGGNRGKRGSGTFACTIQPPCVALLHAPGVAPGESREPAWQAACQPFIKQTPGFTPVFLMEYWHHPAPVFARCATPRQARRCRPVWACVSNHTCSRQRPPTNHALQKTIVTHTSK